MIQNPIRHPAAWTNASLNGKHDLVFQLNRTHLDAFARAIENVRARGAVLL